MSTVITGSGKTFAFGIPMIHAILEWRNSSEKPTDDSTEPAPRVESLYLPAVDESAKSGGDAAESTIDEDEEDGAEVEEEEEEEEDGENVTEQDQGDTDEHDSEDDDDAEDKDEDQRLGCVQVIENAEFNFDAAGEAEEEDDPAARTQPLLGLVLTPTRELAVQVKHHIDAVAKFTGKSFL